MSGELETCIICQQQKPQGIRIFGQFLCTECEQEIVHTDVEDARYAHYIDRMKQIWLAALL